MTSPNRTLIVNSTGKVGRRVSQRLADRAIAHRGVSRRSAICYDWEDETTWPQALEGMDVAFVSFVPDLAAEGSDEVIAHFVEASRAAGLRKIVLLSGRGETGAVAAEDVVRQSGLEWAIVRAAWFNQNFTEGHMVDAVNEGVIALPAADRVEPFVDADDLADVATAALLDNRHNGQVYEVTGPRLMTFADVARELSVAVGHPVRYMPVTLEEFHDALLPLVGEDQADLLRRICAEVFDGRNESLGDGVRRALGRDPRDFAGFVQQAFGTGTGPVPQPS